MLHVRQLVRRPGRLALSLVALVVGTALTVAVGSISASADAGARAALGSLTDADLVGAGTTSAGIAAELAGELVADDDVDHATAVLRQSAIVEGERGFLLGVDAGDIPAFGQLPAECIELVDGAANGGVLVGPGFDTGLRSVSVVAGSTGAVDVPVIGRVVCGPGSEIADGRFIASDLATAQDLAGRPGRADTILIDLRDGAARDSTADRLEAAVGRTARIGSPEELAAELTSGLRSLDASLGLVSVMAGFVAAFLVYNTFSMLTLERRREFATFLALGARPSAVLRRVLVEALVIGAVAAVAGVGVGRLLATEVIENLPPVLLSSAGVEPVVVVPVSAIASGVGVALLACVLGALLPARSATRIEPAAALRPIQATEADFDRPDRTGLAVVCLVAFVAISTTAASATGTTPVLGLLAMFALVVVGTHAISGRLATLAAAAVAWIPGGGVLASEAVRRAPRRAWGTMVAIALSVGLVVASWGVRVDQNRAFAESLGSLADVPVLVQTAPLDLIATDLVLPAGVVDAVEELAGVSRVARGQGTYITISGNRVLLEAFDGPASFPVPQAASPAAQRAYANGDGAIVNSRFADNEDLDVGSTLVLDTPTGSASLPVLDVVETFDLGGGTVLVPFTWFETTFARQGPTWLEVIPTNDSAEERTKIAQQIRTLVEPFGGAVAVGTGQEVFDAVEASVSSSGLILVGVALVLAGCSTIAVTNTLLLSVIQRRRELAVLRALGGGQRPLVLMVTLEAIALAVGGGFVGLLVGGFAHWVTDNVMSQTLSAPIDFRPDPLSYALGIIAALAIGAIGSTLPALSARTQPVLEAIAYE